MAPALASSGRARPGAIGRPAASADVQPFGRSAPVRRSKAAPEPASQPSPERWAPNSSYSLQVSCCTTSTWRSDPPSTRASSGTGYGPGSDSSGASVNVIGASGWDGGTIVSGIPYAPPPPKSGCSFSRRPIAAT